MPNFASEIGVRKMDASMQLLASSFHCGNTHFDNFINSSSAIDDQFGTTYVWLSADNDRIIGFYNITAGSVEQDDGYCRIKIGGAIHINEFAVDSAFQKTEIGPRVYLSDYLLQDCISRIRFIRENHVGVGFITLQSTAEGHHLYARNGFEDCEADMIVTKGDIESDCVAMYYALDYE